MVLGEAVDQAAWLARQAGDGMILAAEPVQLLTDVLFESVPRPNMVREAVPPVRGLPGSRATGR